MNLQERKTLLERLGSYMLGNDSEWLTAKRKAYAENPWFIPEFIDLAAENIASRFLTAAALNELSERYALPDENPAPKKIGIVMAGNIPMVGFHDMLCVIMSGHHAMIKTSSKDTVLISHLVNKMKEWETKLPVTISEMIKGCDAYIATGSNNSSRYFEYYFRKYPHIIRKNRTSVAVLTGKETRGSRSNWPAMCTCSLDWAAAMSPKSLYLKVMILFPFLKLSGNTTISLITINTKTIMTTTWPCIFLTIPIT